MSQKTKKNKNDTSNLKTIKDVKKKYKSRDDLLEENTELRQVSAVQELSKQKLLKLVEEKDKEIAHLKELLTKSVKVLDTVERIEVNDEEMIAELQLQKLKGFAQNRELTLEEAKKFEIYSKIKQNVNKNRTIVPQYKRLPENITQTDLLAIADGNSTGKKVDNDN